MAVDSAPLVLGAAGFLGLNLVDELLRLGVTPRCGRRARTNVLGLRSRRVPLVRADLDDEEGLAAAMSGTSTVYHLAGHYPRLSLDREGALATGLGQLQRALDAAAAAGVRRMVYVSSTASVARAPSGPSDETHVFASAPGFGVYHDLKWEMERLALAERRFEVVVACPGACLGAWDLRVGTSALLVALARDLDPPHPDGIVSLVDARDVARALVTLGTMAAPPPRVLLSGGSHRLHPLLRRLSARYGARPPSPPLPAEEAIALADLGERAVAQHGGRATLSREIADLVVHGAPISARLSEEALGLGYRPLEDTLDHFDAWARRLGILPPQPAALELS